VLQDDLGLLERRSERPPSLVDDLGLVGLPEVAKIEVIKSPSTEPSPASIPQQTQVHHVTLNRPPVVAFL